MKKKGRIENYEDVTATWIIAPPLLLIGARGNMLFLWSLHKVSFSYFGFIKAFLWLLKTNDIFVYFSFRLWLWAFSHLDEED